MKIVLALLLCLALFASPVSAQAGCKSCWDIATTAIESWLEIFLYGGTFAGCADFCNKVQWGEACIAACTVLGDEAFFKLLNYTDLDPIYLCQILDLCPIDDCAGQCGTINEITAKPDAIVVPPQDHDFVTFTVNYSITKKWTGTGVLYFQVIQCENGNCVFVANNFQLLLPQGQIGSYNATFYFNYDCPIEWDAGQPLTAQVFLCNGNCDEYGVARHPHSALYDQGQTLIGTDSNGDC